MMITFSKPSVWPNDSFQAIALGARWAYPAIGIRQTPLEHGEIEISIGSGEATNGQFRLNTAELNLFTVALFLLCAPLVNNPLQLLVLDDPLQNMDELTVTALARGVSRLMRYYSGGWQLLMLFHGQDNFERVRQELLAVSYRLPWLSPAAEGTELAIETDERLSNRPALLIEMPELGAIDTKQAASLAGLAPMTQASGTWKGKDHIRGGRAVLRHALYMPALVAARFNPDLKRLHQRLTDAGKPPKVVITAVMPKLIVFANALLQKGRGWNKKTACS